MSEPSFLDLFRCRWQEIARRFWPETPCEQVKSELARLDVELERRQSRLLLFRKKTERLHHRLGRLEHRQTMLAGLMQKTPADTDGLAELERRQRSIDRLRERLQERERGYARRLACLRQRKQERAELRERLLSGAFPKRPEEESDADYPF